MKSRLLLVVILLAMVGLFVRWENSVGAQSDEKVENSSPRIEPASPSYDSLDAAMAAAFEQQQKLVPGLTASDSFGSDVAISGDTAVVGVPGDDVGANQDQGSVFVFVRSGTTWSQQARLFANDAVAGAGFGFSVSISANTIVVGAPSVEAAYVFVRSGTVWSQQAKLIDPGFSFFGRDVAVDGDYAAIGAGGFLQGTAKIFRRSGTIWTLESSLSSGTVGENLFGFSVALNGSTLIIGSPDHEVCFPSCSERGAAYIYVRSGTVWNIQGTIEGDSFTRGLGGSVAISGNTVAIGTRGSSFTGAGGRVEIWFRSGTTWTQQFGIAGASGERVGEGVAIDGDTVAYSKATGNKVLFRTGTAWAEQATLTSVGKKVALSGNTLLSGSPGFVKVDFRTGATWAEQAELTAQEGLAGDRFGSSVAIDGDTAIVGVPFKDVGLNPDQGSVFVFKRIGTAWQQEAQLSSSDGAASDRFGNSVAIVGNTIAIGAPQDNTFTGSAYIFTRSGSAWTQRAKITAADMGVLDLFGTSVALGGNTLVVGAPLDDTATLSNSGSVYVFTGSGAIWTQQAKLRATEEANQDQFGHDVAIDGETVAVGARFVANGPNTLQGAAYVFTRTGASWTQQARMLASDGQTDDNFGESIAVSGNTLAVGAPNNDLGSNLNQGAAYIFSRSGTAWTQSQILTASDGGVDDKFGISVAMQKDALLVGASGDDFVSTTAQGSAYVFIPFGSTWTQTQKLFALDGATDDGYGNVVALNDRTFLIGASSDDFGAIIDQGSAFVIVPSGPTIWTGANTSEWSTGVNWNSSVDPNVFDDVLLPASGVTNEAFLNVDASVHSLTVEAGRQLTINAGSTLAVNGDFTLNGIITGGGTLVFNGTNFINNNSVNVANVQFGPGLKLLSGSGFFFGNTVTVLSGSTLALSTNHAMNRIVIDSGGTLDLPAAATTLSLFGSGVVMTNNGGAISGSGVVSFDGSSAQSTSGNVSFTKLTINNAAGATLGADSSVTGVLNLASGDLFTGASILTMPAAATSTGATDVVGNVRRTGFTISNTLSFGNPFNTIQFTSGTLPLDVTINLVKSSPAGFANSVRRTYTITPNGGSGFTANLRLHYQDSELNGNTESTLGLWRRGASWANLGATTRSSTDNWVQLAGIAQFSPWTISGPLAPTAANATVSGRVVTDTRRGISKAYVTMIDAEGNLRSAVTNPFGYYRFVDVRVGEFYVLSVRHKRWRFETRVVSVNEDLSDLDFVALP